jgi:hypothetical protein
MNRKANDARAADTVVPLDCGSHINVRRQPRRANWGLFTTPASSAPLTACTPAVAVSDGKILLLVPDRRFHFPHELGRCLSDPMLLCVFHRVLQNFFLGIPPDDMRAP